MPLNNDTNNYYFFNYIILTVQAKFDSLTKKFLALKTNRRINFGNDEGKKSYKYIDVNYFP